MEVKIYSENLPCHAVFVNYQHEGKFPENGKALNSILRVLFGTSEGERFKDPLPSRSVSVYFPKSPGVHGEVTYRKKYSFQTFICQ